MDAERFENLVDRMFDHCKQTLTGKGEEYARNGDRLWNFKEAGRLEGKGPERALQGMKIKQYVSVRDIVDDVVDRGKPLPPEAYLLEKFGDEINYYLLLLGLLYDRDESQPCSQATITNEMPGFIKNTTPGDTKKDVPDDWL